MKKYAKAIVAAAVLVVAALAQSLGVDLGELGANVQTETVLQGLLTAVLVYGVRNGGCSGPGSSSPQARSWRWSPGCGASCSTGSSLACGARAGNI